MDVFNNYYLMRDICGLNCELDNVACSKAELWDVLKLRIQPGQQVNSEVFTVCAKKGNIQFMEFLTVNKVNGCTTLEMDWAAEKGYLKVVKWLHENRTEGCTILAMDWAADHGALDVVKWLHEN